MLLLRLTGSGSSPFEMTDARIRWPAAMSRLVRVSAAPNSAAPSWGHTCIRELQHPETEGGELGQVQGDERMETSDLGVAETQPPSILSRVFFVQLSLASVLWRRAA